MNSKQVILIENIYTQHHGFNLSPAWKPGGFLSSRDDSDRTVYRLGLSFLEDNFERAKIG